MRQPERAKSGGITGYTVAMAKVMISLPDALLAQVDAEASAQGLSRSAAIRGYIEAANASRAQELAARMQELEAYVAPQGGDVVADLKAARDGRYR